MLETLSHETLKNKQRELRHDFQKTMALRVHRSISWIGRAEQCDSGNDFDTDAKFIFLWIAFNAAYADKRAFQSVSAPKERAMFAKYFLKLVELDSEKRIYNAIWEKFSGPIRLLMNNKYVFEPFWKHVHGFKGFEAWENKFDKSNHEFNSAFKNGNSVGVLSSVFERLYVLRNQLVHGGSTWNSKTNRKQVRDGAEILGFLLPIFVDIMMDNPKENWGEPFYPVQDEADS